MYNSANPNNPRVIKNCLNNDDASNNINYCLNSQCLGKISYVVFERYPPVGYVPVNNSLGYKHQSDNVVQGNNRCLFSDPHKTHKYNCVGRTWGISKV